MIDIKEKIKLHLSFDGNRRCAVAYNLLINCARALINNSEDLTLSEARETYYT